MFSKVNEKDEKKNFPLSNLPLNFKTEVNSSNLPINDIKRLDIYSKNINQNEIPSNENTANDTKKSNVNSKVIPKTTPFYKKKLSVNSILNTNNDTSNLDLKNLNDINKKYTLFEDVALEKIYDDIQKDLQNNFSSENCTSKISDIKNSEMNNFNPGVVFIKKKPNENNPNSSKKLSNKTLKEMEKYKPIKTTNNQNICSENPLKNLITNSKVIYDIKKPVKEEDLFLTMTKRLNFVEIQLKENKKLLDEKTKENERLKNKLDEMQIKLFSKEKSNNNLLNTEQHENYIDNLEECNIENESGNNEITTTIDIYSRPKNALRSESNL